MKDKRDKSAPTKEPTAIELLRAQPKAFQVGPQLHLRKGFPHFDKKAKNDKIGVENVSNEN
jgi:hypothetical protein